MSVTAKVIITEFKCKIKCQNKNVVRTEVALKKMSKMSVKVLGLKNKKNKNKKAKFKSRWTQPRSMGEMSQLSCLKCIL